MGQVIPDPNFNDPSAWVLDSSFCMSIEDGFLIIDNCQSGTFGTPLFVRPSVPLGVNIGGVYRVIFKVVEAPTLAQSILFSVGGVSVWQHGDGTGVFNKVIRPTSGSALLMGFLRLTGVFKLDYIQVIEMHVRDQIIDAVVTALTGLPTTGSNISKRRTYPVGGTPRLNVYWESDETDYEQGSLSSTPMRVLNVHVEGYTKGMNESQANEIAEEVETAIYVDQTFGGLAVGMEIGGTEIIVDGDGEKQVLIIDMEFRIFYRVAEGAPNVAT